MDVELVAVGDELLYGDIVNRNAAWLGEQLDAAGLRVRRSVVVPDSVPEIAAAVSEALLGARPRAGAVVLTGGLGPTQDDLTRQGLAAAAGVELVRDDFLESVLRRRFAALGRAVPERNFAQADLPRGAAGLPNPVGTAPGVRLEVGAGVAYALPGPPHEMQPMFRDHVLPDLLRRAGEPTVVVHRVLRTAGIWESAVAEALAGEVDRLAPAGNPVIAFLASGGQTRVKITARAPTRAQAEELIAPVERFARSALGPAVYGTDGDSLEAVVLAALRQRGETLACAESLTAGLLTARLADVPGASQVLLGGVVAYATPSKADVLGVDPGLLAGHGAVSPATCEAMAQAARERFGSAWGVSLTGVAGPDPQEGEPPGTVFAGVSGPAGVTHRRLRLPGDRARVRSAAVVAALDLLRRELAGISASRPRPPA